MVKKNELGAVKIADDTDVKIALKKQLSRKDGVDGINIENVDILPSIRLRFFNGLPWRWEVGLNDKTNSRNYVAFVTHPHLKLIGILRLSKEYTGTESADLTYIYTPEEVARKRSEEFEKDMEM